MLSLQEEVKKEPSLALDGGEDGLKFYKLLAIQACERLETNGKMFMEIGFDQADAVVEIFKKSNKYKDIKVIKDISDLNRIVVVVKNDD